MGYIMNITNLRAEIANKDKEKILDKNIFE